MRMLSAAVSNHSQISVQHVELLTANTRRWGDVRMSVHKPHTHRERERKGGREEGKQRYASSREGQRREGVPREKKQGVWEGRGWTHRFSWRMERTAGNSTPSHITDTADWDADAAMDELSLSSLSLSLSLTHSGCTLPLRPLPADSKDSSSSTQT